MYIGVDLGSTNIKAALYDGDMHLIDRWSQPVSYIRENGFVEFDALQYLNTLLQLLEGIIRSNHITRVQHIAFTGQAESLIVLDESGMPLMNAISWMDERSTEECRQLAQRFSPNVCVAVTGQREILPTWPATKILWLKHNRPDVFQRASCYMLLKDYIVSCFTGNKMADMSIATFTFYFDIYRKTYWKEMLDAIGISERQLPALCEPCTAAGRLLPGIARRLSVQAQVNVGTLDHFAGMIGTGNIRPGGITLSTGTVMALATMCARPSHKVRGAAVHYGFFPDTYVLLPVAESGGASLEWFRRSCMPNTDYDRLDQELAGRGDTQILFLPYLVGTNAPEFDQDAVGAFWGLRQEHDAFDMAKAVMEGVAFVLRKNCQAITGMGAELTSIIATGGGARSEVWCQLQADITGLPVCIPTEKEAACLGAAIIAAVSNSRFADYQQAVDCCVSFSGTFEPRKDSNFEAKYRRFCAFYDTALKIGRMT